MWNRLGNRKVQAFGAAISAAALVALAPLPAAAASRSIYVRTFVSVWVTASPGAIISLIQVCPAGGRLDPRFVESTELLALNPAMRLRSRELWPAGMVTRWTVIRPTSVTDLTGLQETLACRVEIGAASTYVGRVKTVVRIWGPAAARRGYAITLGSIVERNPLLFGAFESTQKLVGLRMINAVAHAPSSVEPETITGRTIRTTRRGTFSAVIQWNRLTSNLRPAADPPDDIL
jgi:hypothetical protein